MLKVEEKQFLQEMQACRAVDIINEKLGGTVLSMSDEWFAAAENLIKPNKPIRDATKFTHAGAWYDGWETRRHNENEYDWVIIKAGVNGAHIIGAEIDTAFFNGNQAPFISIDALYDEKSDNCIVEEDDQRWDEIFPKVGCGPSQNHFFILSNGLTKKAYNYIKLKMYPDGGIARFRLYGQVVPAKLQKAPQNEVSDLAYVGNGGTVFAVSDEHFGSASNLLLPGRGHDMSDGWETKRSRTPNHVDWAIIQLARESTFIEKIIVDTAHYRGNFPQFITVQGCNKSPTDDTEWIDIVGKSKTGPDSIHEYSIGKQLNISYVKLTIIPDGGVKRIRVIGC